MSTLKAFLSAREDKQNEHELATPIELVVSSVHQKPAERDLIAADPNPDLSKLRLLALSKEGAFLAGDTELTADEVREAIARMSE